MIDLFENIITGEKLSKYRTNHFHMFVDVDLPFSEDKNRSFNESIQFMSDEVFGTLIHEYVHFVQHLTTMYCIRLCDMYHRISMRYRTYIQEHDEITLPLQLWNDEDTIQYLNGVKEIFGSKSCSYNIDEIEISLNDLKVAKKDKKAVNIGGYDFENNKIYENGFSFGYTCVIESMAHSIQKIFDPDVHHSTIPYCAAEIVLEKYYPELVNDNLMIASICYCALHWDNPGVGFFEVVDIVKQHPEWDGRQLYKHIAKDYAINIQGLQMPRYMAVVKFLDEFIHGLENLLGTNLEYYSSVVVNCKVEAMKSESFLLDVLYNVPSEKKQIIFNSLVNFYGYPVIDANNCTILPKRDIEGQEKPYLETAVLFGWELILSRIREVEGKKACDRLDICRKGIYDAPESCAVSEYCVSEPWKNNNTCPFTECMKYFGFTEKKFFARNFNTISKNQKYLAMNQL